MDMDIKNLPDNQDALKRLATELYSQVRSLKSLSEEWRTKYESLLESFKITQQLRYGASSEKNILQDDFFDEPGALVPEETAPESDEAELEVSSRQRKKHPTRTSIPDHFPREVIEYDILKQKNNAFVVVRKNDLVKRFQNN